MPETPAVVGAPMPPVPPITSPQPPLPPPAPPLSPGGGSKVYGGNAKRDLLGWLSLVLGVLGFCCCCCKALHGAIILAGIPAIVLGFLHIQRTKRGQASMPWLGWIGIALGILTILVGICGFATSWDDNVYKNMPSQFGDWN